DPPNDADHFQRDIVLDPGDTFTGTVVGPDDQPLAGARAYGLTAWGGWERPPLETASFTVRAFNSRRPRLIIFIHPERKLVGALEPPTDKTGPVCVGLRSGAAVIGRLVDEDGKPRANVRLSLAVRTTHDSWAAYFPDSTRTDQEGRFRLETLLPGQ